MEYLERVTHRQRLRVARAGLSNVVEAERRYLETQPYHLVHRYDPRAAEYTVRVDVVRPIPADLPPLVAGVLLDATATLDALASSLASLEGAPGAGVRFPLYESLPQFAQRTRRLLSSMPDEAQATIEALQPYHTFGGFRNDPLWIMRALLTDGAPDLAAGALREGATLGVNTKRHVEVLGDLRVPAGPFAPGSAVTTVAARVAGPDPKLDMFLRPSYELAFATTGPARGASLVGTLGAICDRVEHDVVEVLERLMHA